MHIASAKQLLGQPTITNENTPFVFKFGKMNFALNFVQKGQGASPERSLSVCTHTYWSMHCVCATAVTGSSDSCVGQNYATKPFQCSLVKATKNTSFEQKKSLGKQNLYKKNQHRGEGGTGSRFQEPGSRFQVPRFQVPGTRPYLNKNGGTVGNWRMTTTDEGHSGIVAKGNRGFIGPEEIFWKKR